MKTDADFHRQNASNMMHVPLDKVTKTQRSGAKNLSFMICYSKNPAPQLADRLNCTQAEAQELINNFLGAYPGVYRWFNEIEAYSADHGRIYNILGARRALYGLFSRHKSDITHALNMTRNAPIQGPASIWTLMAAYDFLLQVEKAGVDIRLINGVHDALYAEIPIDLIPEWAPKLLRTMERSPSIDLVFGEHANFVPMAADCEIGLSIYTTTTWDDTDVMMNEQIIPWLKAGAPEDAVPVSRYERAKPKEAAKPEHAHGGVDVPDTTALMDVNPYDDLDWDDDDTEEED